MCVEMKIIVGIYMLHQLIVADLVRARGPTDPLDFEK
jgi:hypothetical protein